jgi:hypothetical protein
MSEGTDIGQLETLFTTVLVLRACGYIGGRNTAFDDRIKRRARLLKHITNLPHRRNLRGRVLDVENLGRSSMWKPRESAFSPR